MTFDEILAIENADQQAVALEYNGNAIIKSGAELVHASDRGNELFKVEGKPINEIVEERELYFLRMTCPTGRTFVECINPQIARIAENAGMLHKNADYAQADNCGLTFKEYNLLQREA